MYEPRPNITCTECGSRKSPNRWLKCPTCHRAHRDGLHRIAGRPFYLAPLGGAR